MMQNELGNIDDIPETFPDLAFDLGVMLAERDRIDEALEMIGSFGYAVQGLYGNPAFTNFEITLYVAQVYYAAGDIEQAIETLENYINIPQSIRIRTGIRRNMKNIAHSLMRLSKT